MFVMTRVLALVAFGWILVAGSPEDPPTPSPTVVVEGATPAQADRLALALDRFAEAGLQLPDLHVEFPTDPEGCHGHLGLFALRHGTARILICGEEEFLYEHELAHAWEATSVSDETRAVFMEYRGYETWSSSTVPWQERGVEGAAFILQQGVAGIALQPTLSAEWISRLVAYELLTNRLAPRLSDWMSQRSVACSERPTPLSSSVPDAAGLHCAGPGR